PPSPTLSPYTTLFRSNQFDLFGRCVVKRQRDVAYPNGARHRPMLDRGRQYPSRSVTFDSTALQFSAMRRPPWPGRAPPGDTITTDRKSTRLNSSHVKI